VKSNFFIENRQRLVESLHASLIVVAGWTSMQWHGDSAVPFRQEANFWYLTGVEYADWRLVIDGDEGKTWLIAPDINEVQQLFDGSLSPEIAKSISGVDSVIGSREGKELLLKLAKKHRTVHSLVPPPSGKHIGFMRNPAPEILYQDLSKMFSAVKDSRKVLARLRAVKLPVEIEIMQRAAQVSAEAFEDVKSKLQTRRYEYEVEAEIGYYYRRHNADHAFEPIVASGKNACTLHYVANAAKLQSRQLVLIDSGARLDGYSADITRTHTTGEPTARQRAVHEAVRSAEGQITALIRPGTAIKAYTESVDAIMKEVLVSLGLMRSKSSTTAYRRYFPHAISHGLGIDVHEGLGGFSEFLPGMVLTVEPGVYIPEESIGVRVENTILVTDSASKNLTGDLSTDL